MLHCGDRELLQSVTLVERIKVSESNYSGMFSKRTSAEKARATTLLRSIDDKCQHNKILNAAIRIACRSYDPSMVSRSDVGAMMVQVYEEVISSVQSTKTAIKPAQRQHFTDTINNRYSLMSPAPSNLIVLALDLMISTNHLPSMIDRYNNDNGNKL